MPAATSAAACAASGVRLSGEYSLWVCMSRRRRCGGTLGTIRPRSSRRCDGLDTGGMALSRAKMTSLRPRAVMVILMAVTLFVFAFPVVLADFGPGALFYYRLLLFPADLALAATTIFVFWVAVSQRVRPGPATMLLGAFTVSLAVAWLVHPSPQGVQIVARFVGATSLALGFSILRRDERVLAVGTLTVVTGIQLAVAVAQMLGHGPLGLPSFGEIADPLLNYGGIFAPRGTMHAMYVLAGLALVTVFLIVREGLGARTRIAVFITAGILAAIVGLTMSRAAALGLVVSCGALLLGVRAQRRSLFQASAALATGAFVAALICLPGWTLKAATGLSGREIEVDQSTSLIPGSFLIGIGPGRSYAVLEQRYPGLPW